ncbi:hypothetical protein [Acinetobacter beijerinckii]|uniref:hypothetical protein n=1 Tax=Acinetobacter beijerinckii TaxID=262668 RepID=UPI003AF4BB59
MMNVLFFPANKLGASIAPIYNGHTAIVCQNTDRLKDGKYALAELNLFKHNIQGTSFLNPFPGSENANYAKTIEDVRNSGRISFGLYQRSDYWINPTTNAQEQIPDYYLNVWTAAGAAAFQNAVIGEAKAERSPNHGQQFFNISNGDYGFDVATNSFGLSNGYELYEHIDRQLSYFKNLANLTISTGSYTNGQTTGSVLLPPKMLGLRTSSYSVNGTGNIKYNGLTRQDMVLSASTTRTWDAVLAGQFPDQAASLLYTKSEIARAIAAAGCFSDFMHWHSLYEKSPNDVAFFDPFYQAMNEAIGASDVWRAGNNEVFEYYAIKQSINKIGSFISNGKAFVALRLSDAFAGTETNAISNALPLHLLETPISIQLNLSGTVLAGKNLKSAQASTLRNLGSNVWIANVAPINSYKNGYMIFEIEEAATNDQVYDAATPTLNRSGNTVTSNKKSKFVVWRKALAAADTSIEAVHRTTEFSASLNYTFDKATYAYYIGGITRSRMSSLITL